MCYDELVDILVANRFGRVSNNLFIGNNTAIADGLDEGTFFVYGKTVSTTKALSRLFENEPTVTVSTI